MKNIITYITVLSLLTLNMGAQKLQVTGPINIDPVKLQVTGLSTIDTQWNQLVKTNDSLKNALSSAKILIARYKQDSVNYRIWVATKNVQMWAKMDSIKSLKKTIDSLKIKQFADTIEFIGFNDTVVGIYTKVNEKIYSVAPKFTTQILHRYPIKIGDAMKTKEVTITELKR